MRTKDNYSAISYHVEYCTFTAECIIWQNIKHRNPIGIFKVQWLENNIADIYQFVLT